MCVCGELGGDVQPNFVSPSVREQRKISTAAEMNHTTRQFLTLRALGGIEPAPSCAMLLHLRA